LTGPFRALSPTGLLTATLISSAVVVNWNSADFRSGGIENRNMSRPLRLRVFGNLTRDHRRALHRMVVVPAVQTRGVNQAVAILMSKK